MERCTLSAIVMVDWMIAGLWWSLWVCLGNVSSRVADSGLFMFLQ